MKKLYRSQDDRVIGGVAGGLAEFLDIESIWTRLFFIIFTLMSGIGIVMYVIGLLIIPEKESKKTKKRDDKSYLLLGFLLILIGVIAILNRLLSWLRGIYLWAIILIFLGGFLIVRGYK